MTQVKSYFGSDKSAEECWLIELARIDETHRLEEPELYQTRWFDYRHLTPAQATYLFAEWYRRVYLTSYEQTRDIRTVDDATPFEPDDIFESRDMTAMWLARQSADRLGCRYDFYLRFCFTRASERGWRHLPRPNQLYAEELVLDVADAWGQRCRDILQVAEAPRFTAAEFVGHPDQQSYYDWLCNQLASRPNPQYGLSTLLFTRKILQPAFAAKRFSRELLAKAETLK